jgi:hypothetical protein
VLVRRLYGILADGKHGRAVYHYFPSIQSPPHINGEINTPSHPIKILSLLALGLYASEFRLSEGGSRREQDRNKRLILLIRVVTDSNFKLQTLSTHTAQQMDVELLPSES